MGLQKGYRPKCLRVKCAYRTINRSDFCSDLCTSVHPLEQENAELKIENKFIKEDRRVLEESLKMFRAKEEAESARLSSILEEIIYDLHGTNSTMAKYWEYRIKKKGIPTDYAQLKLDKEKV